MKKSLLALICLLPLFVVSCRDPKMGFRAEVVSGFDRIAMPDSDSIINTEKPELDDEGLTSAPAKKLEQSGYQYFRLSNTLEFQKITAKWEQKENRDLLTVHGHLIFAKKVDFGDIELQGELQDGKVLLLPTSEQLRDKNVIKAQAICYSEDDNCSEFFIDVFLRVNKKVFHDQFVKDEINIKTEGKAQLQKTKTPVVENPVLPTAPPTTGGRSAPAGGKPAEPVSVPEDALGDEEESGDDVEVLADFVGTSTVQVDELFNDPAKQTESKKSDTKRNESAQTKVLNQAIGCPYLLSKVKACHQFKGRLQNATDYYQYLQQHVDSPFRLLWAPNRKTYFGTMDLLDLIVRMGRYVQTLLPNFKLTVGDVSYQNGGVLGRHKSHMNGLDADVSYLVSNPKLVFQDITVKGGVSADFYLGQQWKLFKNMFSTGQVEVVYVVAPIKKALCEEAKRQNDFNESNKQSIGYQTLSRLRLEPGHHNHFHMRARCSEAQPRCRQFNTIIKSLGCS